MKKKNDSTKNDSKQSSLYKAIPKGSIMAIKTIEKKEHCHKIFVPTDK